MSIKINSQQRKLGRVFELRSRGSIGTVWCGFHKAHLVTHSLFGWQFEIDYLLVFVWETGASHRAVCSVGRETRAGIMSFCVPIYVYSLDSCSCHSSRSTCNTGLDRHSHFSVAAYSNQDGLHSPSVSFSSSYISDLEREKFQEALEALPGHKCYDSQYR